MCSNHPSATSFVASNAMQPIPCSIPLPAPMFPCSKFRCSQTDSQVRGLARWRAHSITSLTPGTTLQHHPHQLLALPSCSLTKNFPISFSSPHSGTQAPTFTIRTNFFLTTPPIPSISCLAYPGPICPLLSLPGVPTCIELLPGLEGGLAARLLLSISRASSASQSISCSTSRAATHSPPRPQGTPRFPSPMPTPRPPREGR
jgi:hypothetical protein